MKYKISVIRISVLLFFVVEMAPSTAKIQTSGSSFIKGNWWVIKHLCNHNFMTQFINFDLCLMSNNEYLILILKDYSQNLKVKEGHFTTVVSSGCCFL